MAKLQSFRQKLIKFNLICLDLCYYRVSFSTDKLIQIIICMQDKQENTQHKIFQDSQDEKQEEEDLQFNNQPTHSSTFVLWICFTLIIVIIIGASLKIAYILQQQKVIVSNELQQYQYAPISQQNPQSAPVMSYVDRVIDVLEQNYRQVSLQDASQQDVINAQRLNMYHVQYSKTLRKIDYQNAKLSLSQILENSINQQSEIKYKQFLDALALLQLATFPYIDPTTNTQDLVSYEYQQYCKRWKLKQKQQQICAIMILTKKGLNSGNYYYAIRSLFQQKYSNYKAVIIDNTPELGLQANIVGLLKEVGQNRAVILDKISGEGYQGSAVFYAINQYCKDSEITIILRDTGQLIGSYAFALLNQAHKVSQALIVASHYLLDAQNVVSHMDGDFRYRVQLYRPYKNSSNPKKQPYKAKYIKSYKTKLLRTLPQSTFHNKYGFWQQSQLQAKLQFASLQRSCGKFYILDEILYRLPKSSLQKQQSIREAQRGAPLKCIKQLKYKTFMYEGQLQLPYLKEFDSNLIDFKKVEPLKTEDLQQINDNFINIDTYRVQQLKNEIGSINQKVEFEQENEVNNQTGQLPTLKESLEVFKAMVTGYRTQLLTFKPPNNSNQTAGQAKNNIKKFEIENIPKSYQLTKNQGEIKTDNKQQLNQQIQIVPFCILLNTQNSEKDFSFFYSIQSVLKQKYSSFRLTIIDNASYDQTLQILKRYYMHLGHLDRKRVRVVGLKQRKKKGELMYYSVRKYCQSHQFLIFMQTGQQLVGDNVLSTLNSQYQKSNYLAVHAGNIQYHIPSYKFNFLRTYKSDVLKQRSFRVQQLLFHPLRSFRVDLFLRIEQADFKRKGEWLDKVVDFNICYAVLQMTCQRLKFINKVLYKISEPLKFHPLEVSDQQDIVSRDPSEPLSDVQNRNNIKPINKPQVIDKIQAPQNPKQIQNVPPTNGNQKILSIPVLPIFKPKYSCLIDSSLTVNP